MLNQGATATRNPIYFFYEVVERNKNGELGNPGDTHYRCLHGTKQIVTVTKKMKHCLTGESRLPSQPMALICT